MGHYKVKSGLVSYFGRCTCKLLLLSVCLVLISSCASRPPKNPDNLCKIFEGNRAWYKSAIATEKKWGVPVHVPMAIMYQESSFEAGAKPARNYTFFGLIPWGRKSSAYGYSQALDGTWKQYIEDTNRRWGNRANFSDAIDFMGWYVDNTHRYNKVSKGDTFRQYLNYHDGWGGYRKKSFEKKPWLIKVAKKVEKRSTRYQAQYSTCKDDLARGFWSRLFR